MKKTILIVCANGASSNLLAAKIKEQISPREEWIVESKPLSELPYVVAKYDVILIAPQISFEESNIRELTAPYQDIQVMQVSAEDFAMQKVDRIIALIQGNTVSSAEQKKQTDTGHTADLHSALLAISGIFSKEKHLLAIRNSLVRLLVLMMLGSFSLFFAVPPVPDSSTGLLQIWKTFAVSHYKILILPYQLTFGIISLYVIYSLAYEFSHLKKKNSIECIIISLLVYLTVSGAFDQDTMTISGEKFSSSYMLSSILITFLTIELLDAVERIPLNFKLDRTDSVPECITSINFLVPLLVTYFIFTLGNQGLVLLCGHSLPELVYLFFDPIRNISVTLPSILFINIITTTLWFFGLHGGAVLGAFTVPITTTAVAANAEAMIAGKTLPYIIAGTANMVFGNWITYNAFLLTLLIWGRSDRARSTAKVAILPSIFNINEPIIFGLPTVLNVYTYVPLVISSSINTVTYYIAARLNLVGRFYVLPPCTLPGPLQALLGTGDWKAVVLWMCLLAVNVMICRPFMMYYDETLQKQEQEKKNEI